MTFQAMRHTAVDIARQAGAEVMHYYNRPHKEEIKSSKFDIVTEGDKLAESVIIKALLEAFPDHHIVSEESGQEGAAADEADYFWYIDPIDGTSNFANNIPFFSISMALTDSDLDPLVGVVFNPVTGELFSAAQGFGATLNDREIFVSNAETLDAAILASGFPYDVETKTRVNTEAFLAFLPQVRGMRRFGSAALELSYVACGRLDGFWECRLNPWDCLAGVLMVREAGGRVTDFEDDDFGLTGAEIVASNGHLHEAMLDVINA